MKNEAASIMVRPYYLIISRDPTFLLILLDREVVDLVQVHQDQVRGFEVVRGRILPDLRALWRDRQSQFLEEWLWWMSKERVAAWRLLIGRSMPNVFYSKGGAS
jgi:hypothetical protein